jgi:hypothetical protein
MPVLCSSFFRCTKLSGPLLHLIDLLCACVLYVDVVLCLFIFFKCYPFLSLSTPPFPFLLSPPQKCLLCLLHGMEHSQTKAHAAVRLVWFALAIAVTVRPRRTWKAPSKWMWWICVCLSLHLFFVYWCQYGKNVYEWVFEVVGCLCAVFVCVCMRLVGIWDR